jgi:hypothetical protein
MNLPKTFYAIPLMIFFSCSSNQPRTDKIFIDSSEIATDSLREMTVMDSALFVDIKLPFTDTVALDDAVVYKVNGLYEGKNVGFDLSVPIDGQARLYIKRDGIKSDNFLHSLQKLYKQKIDTTLRFATLVTADCISLFDWSDSLHKPDDGTFVIGGEYKLFLKDQYGSTEMFMDINKKEHWIKLKEKDIENRFAIADILTAHSGK